MLLFSLVFLVSCRQSKQQDNSEQIQTGGIFGAGASFPAIVYNNWSVNFHNKTQQKISYQSIGSSAGVKQVIAKTVDFGATDAPLSDEQINKENLFQFPTIIGGIVLAINIKGVPKNKLVLSGPVVADIFQGKIKKWNDPAIQNLNPGLNLPNLYIAVVRRADGSGTTFIFTNYLSRVSASWRDDVGAASNVSWPTGIGAKGNDGVTSFVQRIPSSIGYVEYAYAKHNNLDYAKLINANGDIVSAGPESFEKAATNLDWEKSLVQDLVNSSTAEAWPIVATTYILLPKQPKNSNISKIILSFFEWGLSSEEAKTITDKLDYVPLPDSVIHLIKQKWATEFNLTKH